MDTVTKSINKFHVVLFALFIVLTVLIIVLGGYFTYQYYDGMILFKDSSNLNSNNDNSLPVSLIDDGIKYNNYLNFVGELKKNRTQVINKVDSVSVVEPLGVSSITLDNLGNVSLLFTDLELINKYGATYNVMSQVLAMYLFEYGNSGYRTIIFIREDGKLVSIRGDELINNKSIELVHNVAGVRDVVSLVQISNNNTLGVMAIDINGNTYDITEYLK